MGKKRKSKMEFRYYKMPADIPILALLGQKWVRSYGQGIDYLHFHNCMEIGYCYEGKGTLTIGEKDYPFSGNQFSVIPHNCPHTTTSDPGTMSRWEYLFLDVDKVLRGFLPEGNQKKMEQVIHRINARGTFCGAKDAPEMAGKILQALDIMRGTKEFYAEEAKGVLAAFLIEVARENRDETQNAKDEKVNDLISDALDYVSRHYMEQIRIEALAERCHISETHFRRLFSSCMSMGPLEYINLVRVQNACELLRKTDTLVSEIAFRCGFSTLSTFNRNFKQVVGCSPFEWRKNPENFEQQLLKYEIHSEEGW
jgi:AraC-like DNA-binding protein